MLESFQMQICPELGKQVYVVGKSKGSVKETCQLQWLLNYLKWEESKQQTLRP